MLARVKHACFVHQRSKLRGKKVLRDLAHVEDSINDKQDAKTLKNKDDHQKGAFTRQMLQCDLAMRFPTL